MRRSDKSKAAILFADVDWETLKQAQLPELIIRAAEAGGRVFACSLALIKSSRPDLSDAVDDHFASIAYFYEDEPGLLGAMAASAISKRVGAKQQRALLKEHAMDLAGVQLANGQGSYALLLPDASEPGRVRASFFDDRGFFGHVVKDDYAALLRELFADGYRQEEQGVLERLSTDEAFIRGNVLVAQIQAFNAGQLAWSDIHNAHALSPSA